MFSLSKKNKKGYGIIFDIGNNFVTGSIVDYSKPNNADKNITWTLTKETTFQEKPDYEQLENSIIAILNELVSTLKTKGMSTLSISPNDINTVLCVISSPWHISSAQIIKINSDKIFTVSQSTLDSISKEAQSKIKEVQNGEEFTIIEHSITNITLNGYSTETPLGKKAESLRAHIFLGLGKADFMKKAKETIEKYLPFKEVSFHTMPLVMFSTLRDLYKDTNDFIFVDAYGDVVELSLVKGGILSDTVTFPYGSNMVLRKLSEELHTKPEVTLSLISLYKKNDGDAGLNEKIKNVLQKITIEWNEYLTKSLTSLSSELSIPRNFFVCAPPLTENFFKEIIEKEEFHQFGSTSGMYKIELINSRTMFQSLFLNKIS